MALTSRNFQVRSGLKVVLECWDREILACIMNFHNRVTQPHLLDQIWTWHFFFGNSSKSCQHFFFKFCWVFGSIDIANALPVANIHTKVENIHYLWHLYIFLWNLEDELFRDVPKCWNFRKYLTVHSPTQPNKAFCSIFE